MRKVRIQGNVNVFKALVNFKVAEEIKLKINKDKINEVTEPEILIAGWWTANTPLHRSRFKTLRSCNRPQSIKLGLR